jgi:hypothetical protein
VSWAAVPLFAANINSHHFVVRDLYTGKPIEDAKVSVIYGDDLPGGLGYPTWNGRVKSATTDADGTCSMSLLDMDTPQMFDWCPAAHFLFPKSLVEVSSGRPLVKVLSCAATGYKYVQLKDGVRRFDPKYVGAASEVPGEKARQAGWGFISVGSGARFWLAPGKCVVEDEEPQESSSSEPADEDETGPDVAPSGGLSGWMEVVPNPCSPGSSYDVYFKFRNGTGESVTVNSLSNKGPKQSIGMSVAPGRTVVVKHAQGSGASQGRWVNHPTFYTSAGTVDGEDYVFVVK